MLRFFPKNYNIKHGVFSDDSSLLYTVPRQSEVQLWYPVTLEKVTDFIFPETEKEIIKEKSDIIDLQVSSDNMICHSLRYEIMRFINDMLIWYKKRKNFFNSNNKAAIAKELKMQGFFPFLSEDILHINIGLCFYEKKEEEYIKKEEREVFVYNLPLRFFVGKSDTDEKVFSAMCAINKCLTYEVNKMWLRDITLTNYVDFHITYKLRLVEDEKSFFKRDSFEDLC